MKLHIRNVWVTKELVDLYWSFPLIVIWDSLVGQTNEIQTFSINRVQNKILLEKLFVGHWGKLMKTLSTVRAMLPVWNLQRSFGKEMFARLTPQAPIRTLLRAWIIYVGGGRWCLIIVWRESPKAYDLLVNSKVVCHGLVKFTLDRKFQTYFQFIGSMTSFVTLDFELCKSFPFLTATSTRSFIKKVLWACKRDIPSAHFWCQYNTLCSFFSSGSIVYTVLIIIIWLWTLQRSLLEDRQLVQLWTHVLCSRFWSRLQYFQETRLYPSLPIRPQSGVMVRLRDPLVGICNAVYFFFHLQGPVKENLMSIKPLTVRGLASSSHKLQTVRTNLRCTDHKILVTVGFSQLSKPSMSTR